MMRVCSLDDDGEGSAFATRSIRNSVEALALKLGWHLQALETLPIVLFTNAIYQLKPWPSFSFARQCRTRHSAE